MEHYESLGQKEILPSIFKTLMILIKLLELGIQFLVLGVTRTFLAQFSGSKASTMTLLLEVIALFQVLTNFIPTRITQAQNHLSEDAM